MGRNPHHLGEHPNIGRSLDEFLEKEGILEEVKNIAVKRVEKMKDYEKPHESYERYLVPNNGGFPVRVVKLAKDIRKLRELLWLNHDRTRTHTLYGDDGEMHCNTCMIDFKRDSVDDIVNIIERRNLEEIIKNQEK